MVNEAAKRGCYDLVSQCSGGLGPTQRLKEREAERQGFFHKLFKTKNTYCHTAILLWFF